jgi:DNA-binding MarR family transcriptional regulator
LRGQADSLLPSRADGFDVTPHGDEDHVRRVRAQWARVRPDLDTAPIAVVARLGRVVSYLDYELNAVLAQHGLRRSSWDVLATLRRQGPPYRLSPTTLYQEGMRTSGAMTHRLRRLEHGGLIRRIPDPDDARSILVGLTREGLALVDEVAPAHLDNERRMLSPLSEIEQRTLAELLTKLLRAYEAEKPMPPSRRRRCRAPMDPHE